MSYLVAVSDRFASAATDLSNIGSAVSAARAGVQSCCVAVELR
ncbi:MAG: PE domain-containing protein [Mycobacterium sp.]|nr:PE domain-containing protein [Mycobacterium sp.]